MSDLEALLKEKSRLNRRVAELEREIYFIKRRDDARNKFEYSRSRNTLAPSLESITAWYEQYRARYKAEHEERNKALLAQTTQVGEEDHPEFIGNVAQVLDDLDTEARAAESIVAPDHRAIGLAIGDGYGAGYAALYHGVIDLSALPQNPHTAQSDLWHAWWVGLAQRVGCL